MLMSCTFSGEMNKTFESQHKSTRWIVKNYFDWMTLSERTRLKHIYGNFWPHNAFWNEIERKERPRDFKACTICFHDVFSWFITKLLSFHQSNKTVNFRYDTAGRHINQRIDTFSHACDCMCDFVHVCWIHQECFCGVSLAGTACLSFDWKLFGCERERPWVPKTF